MLVGRNWRLLKATMDERARRLWAGAEADAIGYRGVAAVAGLATARLQPTRSEADAIGYRGVAAVARATGLAISTVRKGRDSVTMARSFITAPQRG